MFITLFFGLIGGLGLFLFGMQRMAEGLQKAAGDRLRQILELFTSHPLIAIVTGAVTTVFVQSSSTTTVMVVGFVNAGLMNLQQAVGTIMGANIGTTITAQIVSFPIYETTLPAIGIGFGLHLLGRTRIQRYVGQSLLGFGLLLLGLTTMSEALYPLRDYPPFLDALVSMGQYPLLGVLAGAVFTVLVQSSSATTALVIAFSIQNLIDLPSGLAIILGANLGTCITAQLAAIGANLTARRAAMAHVLFNSLGVVVFLIVLRPFSELVVSTGGTVTRQVANAHTIFNVTNTVLMYPFLNRFVSFIVRIVPGDEEALQLKPKYLDERFLHSPAALLTATKEILRMADISLEMYQDAITAFMNNDDKMIETVLQKEEVVNNLETAITRYLSEAAQDPVTSKHSARITALMHITHDVERVGDHAVNITELTREKIDRELTFTPQATDELITMYSEVQRIYIKSIDVLRREDRAAARSLIREDDIIDNMEKAYRETHMTRLNQGTCRPEAGVIFLDLISNLERIADHANNLAEAVAITLVEDDNPISA